MLYRTSLPYLADTTVYYAAIADMPWAIWLDSAGLGRYDIFAAQPQTTLVVRGAETEITDSSGMRRSGEDPFSEIRRQLGERAVSVDGVPFAGGAAGYWGYDLARRIMPLPVLEQETGRLPDMAVGIYDWALVLDHQEQSAQLVSWRRFPGTEALLSEILERFRQVEGIRADPFRLQGKITADSSRDGYAAAFGRVQEYLQAGDCYQVNLAQRFSAKASGDALAAYLELRRLSPAPYSAFMNFPWAQILCASPERFLCVKNGRVETMPIKGTRPRGSDEHLDKKLAEELSKHPKDRAENLMIVDLLRNDLGKSCLPGSVHVPKLFDVESYANVHHLVSTVEGVLNEGRDALHVLRDCFPGGSITGAPKLRAMQVIEELEPGPRGIYCGAIGYVGFDGNMDSNIVIRTLVHVGGEMECRAGGGIVADSNMEAEYQETLDKAAGMLELMRKFGAE